MGGKTAKRHSKLFIMINLMALFYHSSSFAVNHFANIPLHLRSESTQTTGYSVKPNIIFLIDNSGSMKAGVGQRCRYRTRRCIEANPPPNSTTCKIWGKWTGFTNERVRVGSVPIPPVYPNDPPENIIDIEYGQCGEWQRMWVVVDILLDVIAKYRYDFYFALEPFNRICCHGRIFDTSNDKDLTAIRDRIVYNGGKGLYAQGGTPTFSRLNATARNTMMNGLQYRCQKSYLILLSDGIAQGYHKPITDSTLAGIGKDYGYDGYFDGDQVRNDAYMFDENRHLPEFVQSLKYYTQTLRTKNFGPFIYNNYVVDADGKRYIESTKHSDRRLTDKAGQPWDGPDPLAHLPGHSPKFSQTAQIYIIGFGLNPIYKEDAMGIELLKNASTPKPDYDPVTNPDSLYYFNALTSDSVMEAFQTIFDEIKAQTETNMGNNTTISPSMGESSTTKKDLLIKAKVETEHWSSLLCFHENNETDQEKNACNKQPSFNNRKLVLNDGKNSYLFSNTLDNDFNNAQFKIRDNNNKNNLEWRDGLLNWFSRTSVDDQIKQPDFVLDYRQRPHKNNFGETRNMGDMINNPIETIGQQEFNKQKYLITSANDGMVYVFRAANSDTHPYDLKFNYMPMAIERNSTDGSDLVSHYYQDLTNKAYGKDNKHPHRYLLNGGFTVVQTPIQPNKPQQFFMVSNMGQAGRGAFAMNIGGQDLVTQKAIGADNLTDPNWYKDLFLFQTAKGADNKFGYTIGTPAVAITRVNREANAANNTYSDHLRELAFINNGVNFPGMESADNESALYIYDVLGVDVGSYQKTGDAKGKLVKKLVAYADVNGAGGLASPVVYDINNDGVADLVYAGDYGGNLYRFDIRNPNPDYWRATRIFKADGPITSAPTLFAVNPDTTNSKADHQVIVVFGTGSDIYQEDLSGKKQQAIYGIYDDYNVNTSAALINKGRLLRQTISYNGKYGELSQSPFYADRYKGWFFNLNTDGERVTTKINQLLSTGMVMTRSYDLHKEIQTQYPDDPCQIGKINESTTMLSRLTQFDSQNGGKVNTKKNPHLILNGNIISSSVAMDGIVGLKITHINEYHYLDAGKSGQQKSPGADSLPENCFHTAPVPNFSDSSQNGSFGGIKKCSSTFKRIGWREIKQGYSK